MFDLLKCFSGNGYNSNGFGPFVPQGLGSPNNFNYPPYGNQFNGPFNPGFGTTQRPSIFRMKF